MWVPLAFLAVEALALALRLWGIDFSAGQPRARPDESEFVVTALRMFDGSLDPRYQAYGWPDGLYLIHHVILRLLGALWSLGGPQVNLGCVFAVNPTVVLVPLRAFSALVGALTLVPVGQLAARLAPSSRAVEAALVAELLLAVNYLHGRDSHYAVTDPIVTLFITWAMALAARFAEEGTRRAAGWTGLLAGLAIACKWVGLFTLPVLGLVALVHLRWGAREGAAPVASPRARLLEVAPMAAGVVLGFALLSPFALLNPAATWAGLLDHKLRYAAGAWHPVLVPAEEPANLGLGMFFHSRVTLPGAFGLLGLAAAVGGLALTVARAPRRALVGGLAVVSFYVAAVGPSRVLFLRYCMPAVPILCAWAAIGLILAASALERWARRPLPLVLLALAAAAQPAVRLVAVDRLFTRPDTRTLAQEWLLAAEARAAAEGQPATSLPRGLLARPHAIEAGLTPACLPVVPPSLMRLSPTLPGARVNWKGLVEQGQAAASVVASRSLYSDRYFSSDAPGLESRPRYVIDTFAVRECGRIVPGDLIPPPQVDPACLVEVERFSPGTPACDATFDLFDAFYAPYTGFGALERFGPLVVIYENRCR